MTTSKKKKMEEKKPNKSGVEKPVSFWGASFTEVLAALLKTKPATDGKKSKKIAKSK